MEPRIPRQESPTFGAVQGVIRQQQSGIGGARVVLAGAGLQREVFTNGDGSFLFVGLTPGAYRLDVSMDGFSPSPPASAPKVIEITAGAAVAVEVLLVPLGGPTPREIHALPPPEPYHQLSPRPSIAEPEPALMEAAADDERQVFVPVKNRWTYEGGKSGAQARSWCAKQFWETLAPHTFVAPTLKLKLTTPALLTS